MPFTPREAAAENPLDLPSTTPFPVIALTVAARTRMVMGPAVEKYYWHILSRRWNMNVPQVINISKLMRSF